MKKLSQLQEDTLKQFTIDKIKEISLEELQEEYLRPAKFKEEKNESKDNQQIEKPSSTIPNRR